MTPTRLESAVRDMEVFNATSDFAPTPPAPSSPSGIELEVCADIADRQAKGIAKYGTTVADNPAELREWLQHAYEEALDQAIYLKRAIREMENAKDEPQGGQGTL